MSIYKSRKTKKCEVIKRNHRTSVSPPALDIVILSSSSTPPSTSLSTSIAAAPKVYVPAVPPAATTMSSPDTSCTADRLPEVDAAQVLRFNSIGLDRKGHNQMA